MAKSLPGERLDYDGIARNNIIDKLENALARVVKVHTK